MAEPESISITIDGIDVAVPPGELLIKAAQDAGTYIPRFCWHPRMKPVGMCRMCLVEVETPRGRMLTTSCTVPVAEGMIVDTRSDVVAKAQEGVLEFLLINHPLDCPVCDKGGECPLQDQTMAYGPGESRFVEEKRHFEKPIPLSDLVLLDRERCILCARCTRFSEEVSGDPLIEFVDRGNATQVITFPDQPFSSYFSGNTVEICPVGALTAKPYRFRARPWDLEAVESVSMVDSFGSKVSVQTSQNEVVRINGVDNDPTNQGWLSDKDRFIFEYIHSPRRLTTPQVKEGGEFREATWSEALEIAAERLGALRGDEVAGLGGARSTNEEAYAFGKFVRTIVVSPHLDSQMGDGLNPQFLVGTVPRASVPDLDRARTILVWAGDLKEELPVLYLRVRNAVEHVGARLVVVHPRETGLDSVATVKIAYGAGDGPDALRKLAAGAVGDGGFHEARELLDEGPVVALIGRTSAAEDPRLAESVAAFARDLPGASILPLVRRANAYGALDMGVAPTLLPGRVSTDDPVRRAILEDSWGPLPAGAADGADGILQRLATGDLRALILLGADPIRDHPDPGVAQAALQAADFTLAFDIFSSDSAALADIVLPVEGFAETEGTVTNLEGRLQKVNRIVSGPGQSRAAWSALDDLARRMGGDIGAPSAEAVMKEIAELAPAYRGIHWDTLDWGSGREGVVVPGVEGTQALEYIPVDSDLRSEPSRWRLHLGRVLYDEGTLTRMSPSLARLAPQAAAYLHPRDAGSEAVVSGDIVRVTTGDRSVELPAIIDPTLVAGTVYVPFNVPGSVGLSARSGVVVERLGGAAG